MFFRTQPYSIYLAHTASWRGNYRVWREKYELALALSENDLELTSPCPTEPVDPVREENETDADFTSRQRDYAEVRMKYDLKRKKWDISNRKCLMVAKSTIFICNKGVYPRLWHHHRVSQESGESVYWLFKGLWKHLDQEVIQWEILWWRDKMSNTTSKLKPIDLGLKGDFLIHLVFASLPKGYETFVVN